MRYELRLATSPRHRLRQAAMMGLALGTLLAFGVDAAQGPLPQPRFWVIFLTSSAIAAMLFHRFLTHRGGFMPVRLDLGPLTLKLTTGRGMPLWEIPFRNLQIARPQDNPKESLLIAGPGIRFLLSARHLVTLDGQEIEDPINALTLLEHQLVTRRRQDLAHVVHPVGQEPSTSTLPTGADRVATPEAPSPMDPGTFVPPQAIAASASLGPATVSISAILSLVFLLQWKLGAISATAAFDPMALLAMGANSSPLVLAGEWQRLITGNLLHGDLRHLLFNGFALVSFGRIVEGRLGTARFLVIFLSACLGGALASALLNNVLISVGASTGILGLVGAYGAIDWYFANDRKAAVRRQGILLFLALVLPAVLVPNADHFGHAGGLLVGLLATGWFLSPMDAVTPRMLDAASRSSNIRQVLGQWLPGGRLPDDQQRRRHGQKMRLANVLAITLTLLFGVVTAWTGWHYTQQDTRSEALALMATPDLPNFYINNAAWVLAIDPRSTPEELKQARQAMTWVEEPEAKSVAAEIDTLATLDFRLGHIDRAIQLQRWAFALEPDEVLAAQLARFENARPSPYLDGFSEAPRALIVHDLETRCDSATTVSEASTPGVTVTVDPSTVTLSQVPVPSEIHVLLQRHESLLALLKVQWRPENADRVVCTDLPADLLACDVQARVSLAATTPPIPPHPNPPAEPVDVHSGQECQLYRLDAETLRLPAPPSQVSGIFLGSGE